MSRDNADDLCDLCMSSGVNVERTTYCGKTIGIECGCDDTCSDGKCGEDACIACQNECSGCDLDCAVCGVHQSDFESLAKHYDWHNERPITEKGVRVDN